MVSLPLTLTHLYSMHHPNILELVDVVETPAYTYIVTDLYETSNNSSLTHVLFHSRVTCLRLSGGELFDHLVKRGHYSEASAATIISQILLAAQYMHARNIVHRDIKV